LPPDRQTPRLRPEGLVEYAFIIAVIAIAAIVAMIFLRGRIQNIFSDIGNNLT
jgi:Flp pilus assembly pilin Flp